MYETSSVEHIDLYGKLKTNNLLRIMVLGRRRQTEGEKAETNVRGRPLPFS